MRNFKNVYRYENSYKQGRSESAHNMKIDCYSRNGTWGKVGEWNHISAYTIVTILHGQEINVMLVEHLPTFIYKKEGS